MQVMGRALFPGAGLFEMAAAAGAALAGANSNSSSAPVLAHASITSPCRLGVGGAVQKLTCILHPRFVCFSRKQLPLLNCQVSMVLNMLSELSLHLTFNPITVIPNP